MTAMCTLREAGAGPRSRKPLRAPISSGTVAATAAVAPASAANSVAAKKRMIISILLYLQREDGADAIRSAGHRRSAERAGLACDEPGHGLSTVVATLERVQNALHVTRTRRGQREDRALRSEEHTSELQSRRDLVCRL